jgi:hypothetical protein
VTSRALALLAGLVAGALLLTSCGGGNPDDTTKPTTHAHDHASAADAPASAPLRPGETFLDLQIPRPYTPKAPTTGTDDYRCFLLDPHLAKSAFVTGLDVVPDRAEIVHHVILFRVPPDRVAEAKGRDAAVKGEGWTCFGGSGVGDEPGSGFGSAPWLGAWAPGSGESKLADDIGIPMKSGSRIVMQVHYNLLNGSEPDQSRVRLRMAPGTADLDALQTMLLPAPVELACRPGKTGRLCDRDAAIADVKKRFGVEAGYTIGGLQLICGRKPGVPKADPVQSCDHAVRQAATIRAVAGHMHLLGRSISITLNPGTKTSRSVLDIPIWNFDDQRAKSLKKPITIKAGDVLRVTCKHDQKFRDMLPALKHAPEKYVVWGDGTTDEMCLGIVMFTQP